MKTRRKNMRLKNKVAVITGGGKGLGKVYGNRMAREGAVVIFADIDGDAAQQAAEQIVENGGRAIGLQVDISSEESTKKMAEQAMIAFGTIDILVNNASLMSVLSRRPWYEIPIKEWDRVMAVNLRGMFLCCLAVYPEMKAKKKGKIINISSGRVFDGTPNRLHYTTSKAGVVGFTRSLAREVGEDNICVNAIAPGLTLSDTQVSSSDPSYIQWQNDKRCFKRNQVPDDLVGAVLFLSSSDSDFMTGQLLNIDGGWNMH
jgi:3-oxoacyl-[acyl-carrier protein] reductase